MIGIWRWCGICLSGFLLCSRLAGAIGSEDLLRISGVEGGLVVAIGGGGDRAASLRPNDRFFVHLLDTDPAAVTRARERLLGMGLCGPVSADRFDGKHLPYSDNLVNLVVVDSPDGFDEREAMRALVPGGVLLTRDGAGWRRRAKPRAEGIDEWTHFLHDASNNAVARDARVGPPRRVQWVAAPLWSRNHEHTSSLAAMVSGGGRIFYVHDEGLTSLTDAPLPERWVLVARDAFNGLPLWRRDLPTWRGEGWKTTALRGRPPSMPRRIVAAGARLFFAENETAGVSVIDAATGETLRWIDGTGGAQEMLLADGVLLAHVMTEGNEAIVAVDPEPGKILWSARANRIVGQTLAAGQGRVVYMSGGETVCLGLKDGAALWRSGKAEAAKGQRRADERALVLHGDLVLEGGGNGVLARNASNGEVLWKVPGNGKSMMASDLFVANGKVWHAAGDGIAGYDLTTGKATVTIDPTGVQSEGHHLRCYPAKATERFLITQFRGAEFVSLCGEPHSQTDWLRGACRYGIMPCNGLLYVPPHPCFCYPGVKLSGWNALAADAPDIPPTLAETNGRLEKGPAYGKIDVANNAGADDWPMYRHDARRSAASGAGVPTAIAPTWRTRLPAPLTAPVVAGERLFMAAKDAHTVYALASKDGRELWHFTAGGRIDSPPTVVGEAVCFGCTDGRVYALRANDGALSWSFLAAPRDRRIGAFGQLESAWPVHGSVLFEGGLIYGTAGRSSFLDGGITIFALDPATGSLVHEARIDTWSRDRSDAVGTSAVPSYHMDGARSDLLIAEGGYIFLGQYKFDPQLRRQETPYVRADAAPPVTAMGLPGTPFTETDPDMESGEITTREFHRYLEDTHPDLVERYSREFGGVNLGDRVMGRHLMATFGFLDDTWFNRTFWMYSGTWPGWYHAHRGAKTGQLIVMGPQRTYAVQAFPTRNRQSPLFTAGDKGYLLIADDNDNEPVLDDRTRGATKGLGFSRMEPPVWFDWVPIRIRAMALAGNTLFLAGPPDVIDPQDPMASFEGRRGAILRALSEADGKVLSESRLDAMPVFDGLIAARGSLFASLADGSVVRLGGK